MTTGPLFAGLGMSLLFFLQPGVQYLTGIFPGIMLFGIGLALLVAPLTTTVMASVNDVHSGIASGINNAISRAAGLIVIAFLGFFGASLAYPFAAALCALLAFGSGLVSFIFIRTERELID
jgi:hypothetical protein